MIVLDTHAWLWWVSKPANLSRAARLRIGAETRIGVSAISCLEVATAVAKGRISKDSRICGRPVLSEVEEYFVAAFLRMTSPVCLCSARRLKVLNWLRLAKKLDCVIVKNLTFLRFADIATAKYLLRRIVAPFAVRQVGRIENLILAE